MDWTHRERGSAGLRGGCGDASAWQPRDAGSTGAPRSVWVDAAIRLHLGSSARRAPRGEFSPGSAPDRGLDGACHRSAAGLDRGVVRRHRRTHGLPRTCPLAVAKDPRSNRQRRTECRHRDRRWGGGMARWAPLQGTVEPARAAHPRARSRAAHADCLRPCRSSGSGTGGYRAVLRGGGARLLGSRGHRPDAGVHGSLPVLAARPAPLATVVPSFTTLSGPDLGPQRDSDHGTDRGRHLGLGGGRTWRVPLQGWLGLLHPRSARLRRGGAALSVVPKD